SVEERAGEETKQEVMNRTTDRRGSATRTRKHEKTFRFRGFVISWLIPIVSALMLGSNHVAAQSKTRAHVETLASPRLEGRLAGSNGEKLAGDYLAAELQKIGAKPLPGRSDFRLPFEFTAGTRDAGSTIAIGGRTFNTEADVRALSFSDNSEASGDVVFAGYGIVVPESQDFGYDSYATLDVKDKIVLVLRYFPEDADQK